MGFADAIRTCLGKYATFSGRASRSEYWWFYLFLIILSFVAGILDALLFGYDPATGATLPVITLIVGLAMLLPSLAAVVRRLHDTDRSGWWYLLVLTVVGVIVLIVFLVIKGTKGPNRFGPDPLGTPVDGVFD